MNKNIYIFIIPGYSNLFDNFYGIQLLNLISGIEI